MARLKLLGLIVLVFFAGSLAFEAGAWLGRGTVPVAELAMAGMPLILIISILVQRRRK